MTGRSIAIIPARGGSKRIPQKNIKLFCGKPIIAYAIETALESNLFDEVMVSTDDKKIAKIAMKYGAKVPFMRSTKNSDDFATILDVLAEVLKQYQQKGIEFESCCCLYSTAPFVSTSNLKDTFKTISDPKFDSVIAIVKYGFPIQRSFQLINGLLKWTMPEHEKTRSQDLKEVYHDAGQFFWFKVNQFLMSNKIITDRTTGFELDQLRAQDIDTEKDWEIAEFKYRYLQEVQ